MTTGVYIAELCLIGLLGLRKAAGQTTVMVVLLVLTVVVHLTFDRLLRPTELYPPIDEDSETAPLLASEEGRGSDSILPGQRLGIPRIPTTAANSIAGRFESYVRIGREKVKDSLKDPAAREEEAPPTSDEDLRTAYSHPALISKVPKLWLAKDKIGTSKQQIQENEKVGIPSSDEGAWLDEENRVRWSQDDLSSVPIFKKPQ